MPFDCTDISISKTFGILVSWWLELHQILILAGQWRDQRKSGSSWDAWHSLAWAALANLSWVFWVSDFPPSPHRSQWGPFGGTAPPWLGRPTGTSKGRSRSASWQLWQSPSSSASSRSDISTIQLCLPGSCPASSWASEVMVVMEFLFHGTTKRAQTLHQVMLMGLSVKKSVSHTEQSLERTWGLFGELLTKHLMELLHKRGKRENG